MLFNFRHAQAPQPPDGASEKVDVKQEGASPSLACLNHTRAGQVSQLAYLFTLQTVQRKEILNGQNFV